MLGGNRGGALTIRPTAPQALTSWQPQNCVLGETVQSAPSEFRLVSFDVLARPMFPVQEKKNCNSVIVFVLLVQPWIKLDMFFRMDLPSMGHGFRTAPPAECPPRRPLRGRFRFGSVLDLQWISQDFCTPLTSWLDRRSPPRKRRPGIQSLPLCCFVFGRARTSRGRPKEISAFHIYFGLTPDIVRKMPGHLCCFAFG